jgi:hypothetical protein
MKLHVTLKILAAPLLAAALLATTGAAFAQQGYGPPPQQGPGGWENAPPQFAAARARGYQDGVAGARKDFDNHRPPNPLNRDEYRHPGFIAPPDRREYREGFRQGYNNAVRHIYGAGPR